MAISHASPGQIIDLHSVDASANRATQTLIKTENIEVIRLVLPAGKKIAEHKVAGEITVQCLDGHIEFTGCGKTQDLRAGQMLYLTGGDLHALHAIENSSVLVSIML